MVDPSGPGAAFVARGWAYDADAPTASIKVHLYVDNVLAAWGTANQVRSDVNSFIGQGGNHGFAIPVPARYLDGRPHTAVVYAINVDSNLQAAGPNPILTKTQAASDRFTNRSTMGRFDVIGADGSVQGWAIDPDVPDRSLTVHLYVDGALQSSASANQSRPDIYDAYHTTYPNIGSSHGYSMPIPARYLDQRPHTITVYAVDVQNPTAGAVNSALGTRTYTFGDATIVGSGAPQVQLRSGGQFAGAIASLMWNGHEFTSSRDHGRLLQSAINAQPTGQTYHEESYNPTEGGSRADGSGPTSTSFLTTIASAQNNRLTTTTQMAFWLRPGETGVPGFLAQNTDRISGVLLTKEITVGVDGLDNAIQDVTTFAVPTTPALQQIQFEVLTAYLPQEFNTIRVYDPASHTVLTARPNGSEEDYPVIFSTADSRFAIAIATEKSPLTEGTDGRGGNPERGPDGTVNAAGSVKYQHNLFSAASPADAASGKVSSVVRLNWNKSHTAPIGGTPYAFTSYVIVGEYTTVRNALDTLEANHHNIAHY